MVSRIAPDRYANTGFAVKDTSPQINERLFAAMMHRTAEERLLMCLDMMATGRLLHQRGKQGQDCDAGILQTPDTTQDSVTTNVGRADSIAALQLCKARLTPKQKKNYSFH